VQSTEFLSIWISKRREDDQITTPQLTEPCDELF